MWLSFTYSFPSLLIGIFFRDTLFRMTFFGLAKKFVWVVVYSKNPNELFGQNDSLAVSLRIHSNSAQAVLVFLIYLKTFKVLSFSIALDSEPALEFLHHPCHYHVRTTCVDVRGLGSSDRGDTLCLSTASL